MRNHFLLAILTIISLAFGYYIGFHSGIVRVIEVKTVNNPSMIRIYDNYRDGYYLENVGKYQLPLEDRGPVLDILLSLYPQHPVDVEKTLTLRDCVSDRIPTFLKKGGCWHFNTGDTMCGSYSDSAYLVVATGDIYIAHYLNECALL